MSIVNVALPEREYDIVIDRLASGGKRLREHCAGRHVMIVADSNTEQFVPAVEALLADSGKVSRAVFPAGEASKSFETAAWLCTKAARSGCDRSSIFIALGGGVTGDLCGFAASIYMRGVDFIQIPTSLLAMVDSSVGGKTGVDLPEGKNLAGSFYQPKLVLIDPLFLDTLAERERIGAFAEIVKYGVIFDEPFFAMLEANIGNFAGNFDSKLYSEMIKRCCELKAETVIADERESGVRALLNYGHTFGHAAEQLSNYTLNHGEAVAIGMSVAGHLSCRLGMWSHEDLHRQNQLLENLGLPTTLDHCFESGAMVEMMGRDKKSRNGKLNFVLAEAIGQSRVVKDVALEDVIGAMEDSR